MHQKTPRVRNPLTIPLPLWAYRPPSNTPLSGPTPLTTPNYSLITWCTFAQLRHKFPIGYNGTPDIHPRWTVHRPIYAYMHKNHHTQTAKRFPPKTRIWQLGSRRRWAWTCISTMRTACWCWESRLQRTTSTTREFTAEQTNCEWTDKQTNRLTDRQADILITILCTLPGAM